MAEESRGPRTVPSQAALHRLQADLHTQIAGFSRVVDAELHDAADAIARDREDVAIAVLTQQIARLESFQQDVERLVSGAVVVREAEGVVDAVIDPVSCRSSPARRHGVPAARVGGLRRGLVAAACLVTLTVVLAGSRPPVDDDPLLAAVTASEEVLAAARDAATGSASITDLAMGTAALRAAIEALGTDVLADPTARLRVEAILVEQHRALTELSPRVPAVVSLLHDLRDLARSLGLQLPEPLHILDDPAGPLVDLAVPARRLPTAPSGRGSERVEAPSVGSLEIPPPPAPAPDLPGPAQLPMSEPADPPPQDGTDGSAAEPQEMPAQAPPSPEPAGLDALLGGPSLDGSTSGGLDPLLGG